MSACRICAISAERGGEEEFRKLVDAVHDAGMGIVLDIVPNHMAVDDANPFWPDPKVFDIDPATGRHRRFFSIDELAGVRQEDPEVFELTHAKVLELVADGLVDGLRIDHPDGLADPKGYLDRLAEASGGRWTVVEKILEPGEELPASWAAAGTTGYDALAEVDDVLVDPAGEAALTALDTADRAQGAQRHRDRQPGGER